MVYNLTPLIALFVLTGCIQNSYMSTGEDIKSTSVLIIMPEQKCNNENMGRILTGEKVLHPAHKECYYK
jgi:predicted small secreted protein